jgi:hypothetical protein
VPPAIIGRTPRVDGFTFKPGDRVTMIHCPLRDGRSGGAIWLEAGYASRAQAEAAAQKS